jgi:hypothetical protein
MLVALDGMTMDPGRLWKPDAEREDDGVLVGGGGGGGDGMAATEV